MGLSSSGQGHTDFQLVDAGSNPVSPSKLEEIEKMREQNNIVAIKIKADTRGVG